MIEDFDGWFCRSKDQQLELVGLDDFYANAPPELTDPVGDPFFVWKNCEGMDDLENN